MAYMSFSPWEADSAQIATANDAALFSPLELRVVNLGAQSDVSRELPHDSRFARLLEKTFGVKFNRPLASPRLERLRRYASMVRHHPERVGPSEIDELVEAGFSAGQAHGLFRYFSRRQRSAYRSAAA